jgi:hypothetical protein
MNDMTRTYIVSPRLSYFCSYNLNISGNKIHPHCASDLGIKQIPACSGQCLPYSCDVEALYKLR